MQAVGLSTSALPQLGHMTRNLSRDTVTNKTQSRDYVRLIGYSVVGTSQTLIDT